MSSDLWAVSGCAEWADIIGARDNAKTWLCGVWNTNGDVSRSVQSSWLVECHLVFPFTELSTVFLT